MNILAVDTSTSMATVAISAGEKIIAESDFESARTLSVKLIPEIQLLLASVGLTMSDIDLFAASIGPGSFTGVRGGIATIQGLALATGKQCAGFSTLTLIAMNFPLSAYHVCSMLDARKNEVYAALHDCSAVEPVCLIQDSVMKPDSFLEKLSNYTDEPVIFAGEGAQRYNGLIADRMGERAIFPPLRLNTPHASNATRIAADIFNRNGTLEPHRLLPVYLRASDAEINKLARERKD